jgi:MoaA/NifB/PqqE/SkfB family radical SAM enzyme
MDSLNKFTVFPKIMYSLRNLAVRQFGYPIKIYRFTFEVTRKCNGQCIYCNIWKTRINGEITIQELKDGLKPVELFHSVKVIMITGGEPFLRMDLVDVCHTLREICPKATFVIPTNGLLPDLVIEKMQEIREIDKNVGILVSIDGLKSIDAIQRGNPQHYDLAWKTAELLKAGGFEPSIFSMITSLNIDTTLDFRHICEERGFSHEFNIAQVSEHYYNNQDDSTMKELTIPESKRSLFKTICSDGSLFSFRRYLPKYVEELRQIFPCFSGFNSFFLSSTGKAYPCIHNNRHFGNIKQKSFGEFWNNKDSKGIRRDIVGGLCHCYTQCEAFGWFQANIFPTVSEYMKKIVNIS